MNDFANTGSTLVTTLFDEIASLREQLAQANATIARLEDEVEDLQSDLLE